MAARTRIFLLAVVVVVVQSCVPAPPPGGGPRYQHVSARVAVSGGEVRINGRRIPDGAVLRPGDRVTTGAGSSARVHFSDGTVIQLAENTDPDFTWTDRMVATGEQVVTVSIDFGWMLIDTGSQLSVRVFNQLAEVFYHSRGIVEARRHRFDAYLLHGRMTPLRPSMATVGPGLVLMVQRGRGARVERFDPRRARDLLGLFERYDFARDRPRPPVQTARVPNLLGLDLRRAEASLDQAGLERGRTSGRTSDDARPGTVVDQSPRPGSTVRRGSAVDLVLAERPAAPPPVRVPSLRGRSPEEAARILKRAGLSVGRVEGPSGRNIVVIGQSPRAGRNVPRGTRVNLETQRVVQ